MGQDAQLKCEIPFEHKKTLFGHESGQILEHAAHKGRGVSTCVQTQTGHRPGQPALGDLSTAGGLV